MAIKFEKIQPGMTLFGTERRRMGNTKARETVAVEYCVISVNAALRQFTVRRNGREYRHSERRASSLSAKNPTKPCCHGVGRHKYGCVQADGPRAQGGA